MSSCRALEPKTSENAAVGLATCVGARQIDLKLAAIESREAARESVILLAKADEKNCFLGATLGTSRGEGFLVIQTLYVREVSRQKKLGTTLVLQVNAAPTLTLTLTQYLMFFKRSGISPVGGEDCISSRCATNWFRSWNT